MQLYLLMTGLFRLFQFSALISDPFKKKLMEKEVSLVMKSANDEIARTFFFYHGVIKSKSGQVPDAGCRLVWKTPEKGAKIMINIATGKPKTIEKAIVRGDLQLQGDAASIKWFLETIQMLRSIYFKRS